MIRRETHGEPTVDCRDQGLPSPAGCCLRTSPCIIPPSPAQARTRVHDVCTHASYPPSPKHRRSSFDIIIKLNGKSSCLWNYDNTVEYPLLFILLQLLSLVFHKKTHFNTLFCTFFLNPVKKYTLRRPFLNRRHSYLN